MGGSTDRHGVERHCAHCVSGVCQPLRDAAGQRVCGWSGPKTTQIYEGTNQIQRVVMARQLLK